MKTPKTIDEAVFEILKSSDIENLKEEDPVSFHHSTGRWLRNKWGLWDQNSPLHRAFNAIGIFHGDDMSGIILESSHRILNGLPVDLREQVKYYQKYWLKTGCDMRGNKLKGIMK